MPDSAEESCKSNPCCSEGAPETGSAPTTATGNCCVLCYGKSKQELWPSKDFNNNRQEAALLLKPFSKRVSVTWAPLSGWPGIIPLSRLGTNATDTACLQDWESFLLAIATAASYLEMFPSLQHSVPLDLKNTLQKQSNIPVSITDWQDSAPISPRSPHRPKSKSQSHALTKGNIASVFCMRQSALVKVYAGPQMAALGS